MQGGNIRESQEAMLMLERSLKVQPPQAFDRFVPPTGAAAASDVR